MPRADEEFDGGLADPADGVDELLDTGPRRQLSRWVVPIALAVTVVLVITVVILRRPAKTDDALPTPQPPASTAAPQPLPTAVPNIALPAGGEPYDVLADNAHARLYAFADDHLYALGLDGSELATSGSVHDGGGGGSDELLLDTRHRFVWVIPQTPSGSTPPRYAQAFDERTLRQVASVRLTRQVTGAAILDGRLYLLGGGDLRRLDPGKQGFQTLVKISADAQTLVADPARHRLLITQSARSRLFIRSWSPAGLSAPVALPVGAGQVQTVDSTIWLGGGQGRTPVLTQLDPRTLHAGRNLASDAGVRTDLVLDNPGVRSLYVADGSGGRISCLDGRSGRALHRFGNIGGIFTSVRGHGFDASPEALHPLPMGRCRG